MPITKSAKKALRQNATQNAKNLKRKNRVKTLVKQVKKLTSQQKAEEAQALMPKLYRALDKAAKAGVIKKNTASRRKSRLTKFTATQQKG